MAKAKHRMITTNLAKEVARVAPDAHRAANDEGRYLSEELAPARVRLLRQLRRPGVVLGGISRPQLGDLRFDKPAAVVRRLSPAPLWNGRDV